MNKINILLYLCITIALSAIFYSLFFHGDSHYADYRDFVFYASLVLLAVAAFLLFSKKTRIGLFTLIGLALVFYFGCWRSYSGKILPIANPMQEKVLAFYKAQQRYPNPEEIQAFLKASGCSDVTQISYREGVYGSGKDQIFINNCSAGITEIIVTTEVLPGRTSEYSLRYRVRYSSCLISFNEGRIYSETRCGNRPCIFTNRIGG